MPDSRIKVFICVEGPHDVRFLNIISKILHNVNPLFPDIENDPRIAMFHLGGSTLKDWVSSNYLSGLGIPEIHIYDRDEGTKPKYLEQCNIVNHRRDRSKAFITGKREMENYLHPDAIKEVYGLDISFSEMDDVPTLIARALQEQGSEQPWEELSEEKRKKKVSRAKARLNTEVTSRMTYERLCEIDASKEVETWLGAVSVLLTLQNAHDMVATTEE